MTRVNWRKVGGEVAYGLRVVAKIPGLLVWLIMMTLDFWAFRFPAACFGEETKPMEEGFPSFKRPEWLKQERWLKA
jgi:hypothetical protein